MGSIIFEAELNRQHPRYRLPMRVSIKDKTYDVLEWSMAGFDLSGDFDLTRGETVEASLAVPFVGYAFGMTVKAVVMSASESKKHASLAFTGLDDRQASLLRYVSDAILAGEIVSAGDVLDVARRNETVRPNEIPPVPKVGFYRRMAGIGRRLVATGAVVAIAAALGSFLWANVYEELYVVHAESANVSAKIVNLASPSVGRIGYLNPRREVRLGEPLMTVNPTDGNPITVQSPCDCLQVDQRFANGDFVKTGDTVIKLMRVDAPIVISAVIPSDRLMSLYGVSNASIVYADGSRVDNADILWLPGKGDIQNDLPRDPSTVVIDPERTLTSEMMGQPVDVTFDLFEASLIGRLWTSLTRQNATAAETPPTNVPVKEVTK